MKALIISVSFIAGCVFIGVLLWAYRMEKHVQERIKKRYRDKKGDDE